MHNSGNHINGYSADLHEEMAVFDKLPKKIRNALANCTSNLSSHTVRDRLYKGDNIIYMINRINRWPHVDKIYKENQMTDQHNPI